MRGFSIAAACAAGLVPTLFAALATAQTQAQTQTRGQLPVQGQAPAVQAGPEVDAENESSGYTPPEGGSQVQAPLNVNGYVDFGFAKAQGDGTSFSPTDTRVPADYGADTFATAVNSRGDVASTDAGGRFVNGFLPRSVGTGGRSSFLLNVANVDLRYQSTSAPVMVFTRVQFLPRFSSDGDASRLFVEQAFGRVMPFEALELAVSAGKFDSVFGIEYLDNQANIRTGITPSLAARYTTGQSVGAKIFFRQHIGPLWSAVSLNAAATNGGTMVESLQPANVSLAGAPVFSARLGYELNLKAVQLKVGGSALRGPRNDQRDSGVMQKMWGADLRLFVAGVALSGEYVRVDQDEGGGPKITALGVFPLASEFHARTYWLQLAYGWAPGWGPLARVSPYVRYERRNAWFLGFTPITVARVTAGLRIDLWDAVIVKGEWLINSEQAGAPEVANNVYTSSVVYQW